MENITVIATGDKITKTNKPYKQLTVRQENGTEHKVNIWSDFPNFANVIVGSVIRGKIEPNGQYMNLVSELQINKPTEARGGVYKTAQIEKTMERKEQSIAKSQDNKDWSIRTASTMNKAVELAIAEIKDITTLNTLENDILKWREWLWRNWEVSDTQYPPF
jgi:hypothetical protein